MQAPELRRAGQLQVGGQYLPQSWLRQHGRQAGEQVIDAERVEDVVHPDQFRQKTGREPRQRQVEAAVQSGQVARVGPAEEVGGADLRQVDARPFHLTSAQVVQGASRVAPAALRDVLGVEAVHDARWLRGRL